MFARNLFYFRVDESLCSVLYDPESIPQYSDKEYPNISGYVQKQEYRYKERNAGNAGNSGNVIFWGMSLNIPGNVPKHSAECHQTFRGVS